MCLIKKIFFTLWGVEPLNVIEIVERNETGNEFMK